MTSVDEETGVVTPGAVEAATIRRLTALEVADLPQAAAVLVVARRLDSPRETGAAIVALSKQLPVMLAELEALGKRARSPLDELRARRDAKRNV